MPNLVLMVALLAPGGDLVTVLEAGADYERAPHGRGNVYAPEVIREGGRWRMWYGAQGRDGHDRIAYAESDDGRKWTRKGVAVDNGAANHVNDPSVVRVGGKWFLYYSRTVRDVVDRIHVATSDDGIRWTPKGLALDVGPEGSWDALSVGRPSVLFENGEFHMWYDGRRDFPPGAPVKDVPKSPNSRRSVGYARSKDGLTWVRRAGNPVFEHDAGGVDVERVGSTLAMLFESRSGTRIATSGDGVAWEDRGLLAPRSGGEVDAFGHVTPFLLVDPKRAAHRLFVGAAGGTRWDRNRIAALEIDDAGLTRRMAGKGD